MAIMIDINTPNNTESGNPLHPRMTDDRQRIVSPILPISSESIAALRQIIKRPPPDQSLSRDLGLVRRFCVLIGRVVNFRTSLLAWTSPHLTSLLIYIRTLSNNNPQPHTPPPQISLPHERHPSTLDFRFDLSSSSIAMATDVQADQVQARITVARREAERLKELISQRREELVDSSRKLTPPPLPLRPLPFFLHDCAARSIARRRQGQTSPSAWQLVCTRSCAFLVRLLLLSSACADQVWASQFASLPRNTLSR